MPLLLRIGGGLLALTMLVAMPVATSAGKLQWESGKKAVAVKDSNSSTAQTAQPARQRHVDPAVQQAAFEYESPVQFATSPEGRSQIRSVVTRGDGWSDALRAAQVPATPNVQRDSQFPDDQLSPLAPMPDELPPLDTSQPDALDLDAPPQREEETPQADRYRRQQFERPPADTQTFPSAQPRGVVPSQPLPETTPTPNVGTMDAERKKAEEACTQGRSDLQTKTINTLDVRIAVTGDEGSDYPFECSLEEGRWHEGRCWDQTTYMWKASALCHKPLYFEDEQLERYGHSWPPCCQPLVSGAHFFTRLPILPYCMGVEPPNECIYALGHYRPGSCAPYMCNPVPLSWRGAVFQAGAVVGAAAVLP